MVRQFDVYWVDLNPTIGAEMQKIRPCVIVSPQELNDHLDTVIIVPVTSAIHGYPFRVGCQIMGRDGEIYAYIRRNLRLARCSETDVLRVITKKSRHR